MIRVYCKHTTNRHRYIFDFFFNDILATGYRLFDDADEFMAHGGPGINYSHDDMPAVIQFRPHPLLSEYGLKTQPGLTDDWKHKAVNQLPADPFALAFYLVTRYEEYLPFTPDAHGRFPAGQSMAFRENFLRIPLVETMAQQLKTLLTAHYPDLVFPPVRFSFIPTFDIDIAFAHLGKGVGRAAGAWARLLLSGDLGRIRERLSVLAGKMVDPYDNFDLHLHLAEKHGLKPLYFILVGNFSRFDRNTSFRHPRFRRLIRELSMKAEIGIHPSYRSYLEADLFKKEKHRLEEMINLPVTKNRFHFLRLKFPDSCRLLLSQGITDDYSMGYSTMNGFRASASTPFFFYDLLKEEKTSLKVHPFAFMDSAMTDAMKLHPEEAATEIAALVGQVQRLGGEAAGIWHNYALSETGIYKGWQQVLSRTMEQYQQQ